MRDTELNHFRSLLSTLASSASYKDDEHLTGFLAMNGQRYNKELLLVGRAVNGWTNKWTTREIRDPVRLEEVARLTLQGSEPVDPMKWVSDHWGTRKRYSTARSAFWRIARDITLRLRLADDKDDQWPTHLAWSNLYKVSPYKGRNPNSQLCDLQRSACIDIMRTEIDRLTPRRILVLTGWAWADKFLPALGATVERPDSKFHYVERVGALPVTPESAPAQVVVARHPERKPHAAFVDEVAAAFGL